ncbi:hypothetical protein ACPB9J_31415 [Streptomyces lavendulocolor]|uniref:hypothetical protein n=1 Tax=Streptomyces lavendulocolor TaxID=67316 RepID=UPI003C2D9355
MGEGPADRDPSQERRWHPYALAGLGEELARRRHLADTKFAATRRLIVSVDSANGALRQLTRYWEKFRDNDAPHLSPAVTALNTALWSGRAARGHVLLDGTPAASILGVAPHEPFGTVILARVSGTTWQRLAPFTGPALKPSKHRGRGHVIQHGEAHETQAIWMTDADVVTWLTDPDDAAARPPVRRTSRAPGDRHGIPRARFGSRRSTTARSQRHALWRRPRHSGSGLPSTLRR